MNRGKKWSLLSMAALGSVALLAMLATGIAVFLNASVPYQPFAVKSVTISKTQSCTGAPISVHIDRKFTRDFDGLKLKESWVDESGRPVETAVGSLPARILKETDSYQNVPSPLLSHVPKQPGTYHVVIHTRSKGNRWIGGLKARGSSTLVSDDVVHVHDCK